LARDDVADEVTRLKAQPGKDMDVGGPTLAATFMRLGLIDEYRLVVHPVVLGAGTPFFPPLDERVGLRLVETHTFGSGFVYLRYSDDADHRPVIRARSTWCRGAPSPRSNGRSRDTTSSTARLRGDRPRSCTSCDRVPAP